VASLKNGELGGGKENTGICEKLFYGEDEGNLEKGREKPLS